MQWRSVATLGAVLTLAAAGVGCASYIDNVKVGSVAELEGLGTTDLRELRYLSPRVATDRWGINHAGGVISVTTAQAAGPDTLVPR